MFSSCYQYADISCSKKSRELHWLQYLFSECCSSVSVYIALPDATKTILSLRRIFRTWYSVKYPIPRSYLKGIVWLYQRGGQCQVQHNSITVLHCHWDKGVSSPLPPLTWTNWLPMAFPCPLIYFISFPRTQQDSWVILSLPLFKAVNNIYISLWWGDQANLSESILWKGKEKVKKNQC